MKRPSHFTSNVLVLLPLSYFITIFLFTSIFVARWETNLLTQLFLLRGPQPVAKDITVVRIDPRSIRRMGRDIRRGLDSESLAIAVEKIAAQKPKLVVLDLFFAPWDHDHRINERLQRAIASVPSVVPRGILTYIDTDRQGKRHLDLERTIPAEGYLKSAAHVVTLMLASNVDGVVTDITIGSDFVTAPLEPVPLLAPLRKVTGREIPEPAYNDIINYYGPPYFVPDVPIYKLLVPGEEVPAEMFQDKVVFVGGVDTPGNHPDGGDDTFLTPMSPRRMSGVEILATIAQNLLDNSWIRRPPKYLSVVLQVVLFMIFVVVLRDRGLRAAILMYAISGVLWAAACYIAFCHFSLFIPGAVVFAFMMPLLILASACWEAAKLSSDMRALPPRE